MHDDHFSDDFLEDLPDEAERLAELAALGILDTDPEAVYDELTRAAAQLFQTPVALITLLDDERQWFKSRIGLDVRETPRHISFCTHAIRKPDEVMVVEDAQLDARFALNPLVTEDPKVRFYAGAPLITRRGHAIGTLCVVDTAPHLLRLGDAKKLLQLQWLAMQVVDAIERRRRDFGAPTTY